MTRAYGRVAMLALTGAIVVIVLLRHPAATPPAAPAAPEPPVVAILVEVRDDTVRCVPATCEIGIRMSLTIRNRTAAAVRVTLSGYEDRVPAGAIAPGGDWQGLVLADRPGEQLAWIVNGEPRGRFDVLGSHLVEGHR